MTLLAKKIVFLISNNTYIVILKNDMMFTMGYKCLSPSPNVQRYVKYNGEVSYISNDFDLRPLLVELLNDSPGEKNSFFNKQ